MGLKYHPDKNKDPVAEDIFKKLSEAYAVLSIRPLAFSLFPPEIGDPSAPQNHCGVMPDFLKSRILIFTKPSFLGFR